MYPTPELRVLFNQGRYLERLEAGELLAFPQREDHPARPQANQPPGTLSRLLAYYERDMLWKVAIVHQYVRPDGSIGGSGRPDPKRLWADGEILYC